VSEGRTSSVRVERLCVRNSAVRGGSLRRQWPRLCGSALLGLALFGCADQSPPAPAASRSSALNVSPRTHDFVIEAQNSVRLKTGTAVQGGDIAARGASGPFLGASAVEVATGSVVQSSQNIIASSVRLGAGVSVGDVQTTQLSTGSGAKHGSVSPLVALPALPAADAAAPGSANLSVGTGQTSSAAPGAYGAVNVGTGATLKLAPGVYELGSLTVSTGARVQALGVVELHVAGRVSTSSGAVIAPAAGTNLSAGALRIHVLGQNGSNGALGATPAAVSFGTGNTITALILVPNGTLAFSTGNAATGAFMARDVDFAGAGANVTFQDGFPNLCTAASCDDTNPCTTDTCLANGDCVHAPSAAGVACSDGDACNGAETCDGTGGCVPGSPVICSAEEACHAAGVCDPASGVCSNPAIPGCRVVHGVVAGSFFSAASSGARASSAASIYAGATVCIDENDDLICNESENSAVTDANGGFELDGVQVGAIIAEIGVDALNGGHPVSQRLVLRAPQDPTWAPFVVSPLSTEVARMMGDDGLDAVSATGHLATRLGVSSDIVLNDPANVSDDAARRALLVETTTLSHRFELAAKMVDRHDVSPTALAANPNATEPSISMKEAEQAVMTLEGIPRYDHVFIIMLENKDATTIAGSALAPNINGYLASGNQFRSYYATGNPSEPNRVAVSSGDDFGITDDNRWNCVDKAANSPEEPQPAGLAACSNATNHNIKNRPNLLTALSDAGLTWRVYSESMNPGRDPRLEGIADSTLKAADHVYTATSPTGARGNPNLLLNFPAQAYATKHNESVNYQATRSSADFFDSNRTLGGGQWDDAIKNSPSTPAGWDVDQFGTDLASGDLANLNYLEPDQCDDMHGITVTGTVTGTGASGTASDCSGSALIYRSDRYTDWLIKKIQASAVWQNPDKRSAIVIMFDEGTVTTGNNSCCGWNPGGKAAGLLTQNGDGSTSVDVSVTNYKNGNKGHGYSIYAVLNNQPAAPKGLYDSDAYSHFSFVRTLEDSFQLSDPGEAWSYMNRSKYTESFIAANILFLPEYAGSADPHYDAVRPMNHRYVIPAGYVQKNGYPTSAAKQVGPDPNQINLWALKP
jgi:hypothetical protein